MIMVTIIVDYQKITGCRLLLLLYITDSIYVDLGNVYTIFSTIGENANFNFLRLFLKL